MRANVRKMGKLVGEEAKAEQIIAEFDAKLKALQAQMPPGEQPVFADIAVNNFIAGEDTFYAEVVNAGGWRTIGQALGYCGFRNVTLEELLKIHPALISTETPWTNPPSMSTLALRPSRVARICRGEHRTSSSPNASRPAERPPSWARSNFWPSARKAAEQTQ